MDALPELERAAAVLMAPPSAVSSDDRHAAEHAFLQFRKTRQPYHICRTIFENCKVDYVLFEAASTLKEAVIREWTLLQKSDIDGLCAFLLNYVTHHKSLQKFVREQILQVVAIIIKRGTLDTLKEARTDLLKNVSQLIANGDKDMQMICCSILKALLTEYSTSSQSANIGLSLEFHAQCKKTFETTDLLSVFLLCVEILQKFVDAQLSSLSRTDLAIFIRYLSLAEQVLNWEFLTNNPLRLLRISNETAQINLFKPPKSWKQMILNPNLLQLFFKLHHAASNHEELMHHCLQCLTQLASLSGVVLQNDETKVVYLSRFLQGFLHLIGRTKWTGHEAFGCATIVSRIVSVFPMSVITSLPSDILKSFFEVLASLTCTFQECSLNKEECEFDDNQYEEALDLLLDAWVMLVTSATDFGDCYFMPYSVKIFNAYLKAHLAPPDGTRNDDDIDKEVGDIDCDVEEDDRVMYSDELSDIGCLARQALPHVIPVLSDLLGSRTKLLVNYLQNVRDRSAAESNEPDKLFEDLHWLILIITHVLTYDTSGELPTIPTEILKYEKHLQQTQQSNLQQTLTYVSDLELDAGTEGVDRLVELISRVLVLAKVGTNALNSNLSDVISPEVAGDLLWFMQRWTLAYLYPMEKDQPTVNGILKATFGKGSESGNRLIRLVLETAEVNLVGWSAEATVAEDAVQLLLKLVKSDSRGYDALAYPHIWRLAKQYTSNDRAIQRLPADVHRHLVEALMKVGSHVKDQTIRERFWAQFLEPIQQKYMAIRKQPNFHHISQRETVRREVITMLESLRGITLATDPENVNLIFQFLSPPLEDSSLLLSEYQNCPEIVELLLQLFVDTVQSLIVYLNKAQTMSLCQHCIGLMQTYSRCNLGKKSYAADAEEDQFTDLVLLMQLLTHILSKDYLDFSSDTTNGNDDTPPVAVVEAVLFGFSIVIPLMNKELLKFPKLSMEYFKLVTFVCEIYPEKIENLGEELFNSLMASIEMALSQYGSDIAKSSFEALASLAKDYFKEKLHKGQSIHQVDVTLKHFLKVIFELILMTTFDMDLIHSASEAFYCLICCNQQYYLVLAQELIAQQTDPAVAQRLRDSFQQLTPETMKISMDKQTVTQFRKNLEAFLPNVKGFLCYK